MTGLLLKLPSGNVVEVFVSVPFLFLNIYIYICIYECIALLYSFLLSLSHFCSLSLWKRIVFVEELSEVIPADYWVLTSDSSAFISIKVRHLSRSESRTPFLHLLCSAVPILCLHQQQQLNKSWNGCLQCNNSETSIVQTTSH